MLEYAISTLDPPEAVTDIERARRDPALFIDLFCWLVPKEGGVPIRFRLWDFQRRVVAELRSQTHLVVLKARQLGLSWLTLAYALWCATCRPGFTVLIISRNLGAGIELLERVRFMYALLPDELQTPIVIDTNNQQMPMLTFANGSRIISLPCGPDAGSGLTAQLIIADEVAKWLWPEETFTALLSVIAGGGTMAVVSTAKGTSNYFANLWKEAQPGAESPNGYCPVFIPSSAHPDRDTVWLQELSKKFPSERRFRQEHPELAAEAFQAADEATFSEFDRQVHHRVWHRQPAFPVWRGVDFGHQVAAAYWFEVQASRIVHVFAELDLRESTSEELARQILARDRRYGLQTGSVPAGVDPAGRAMTSNATESDHQTLRRHGITRLRMVQPSVPSDRVDLIKVLLRDERLLIDCTACPRLAEAFEQAQWQTTRAQSGERIKLESYAKGRHDHYLDALGYGLINALPPEGAGPPAAVLGGVPTPFGSIARARRRYGDTEYS